MYSHASVAVDKGLGFDFSGIADLVKSALPVTFNYFQQQQQLKTIKAMGQSNINMGYNVPVRGLPGAQMYGYEPTLGPSPFVPPPSRGIDMSTILMIGGTLIGGFMLFKMLR